MDNTKQAKRVKRKRRIRKKISGSPERPRMSVYKSNRYVYVQVIDDTIGHTLAAASTKEKELSSLRRCVGDAEKLGEVIGKRLQEKKKKTVIFDRNGYMYQGIVKAVADGARKSGMRF